MCNKTKRINFSIVNAFWQLDNVNFPRRIIEDTKRIYESRIKNSVFVTIVGEKKWVRY